MLMTILGTWAQVIEKRTVANDDIEVGAERVHQYLHLLENQSVGIVCNQTSFVDDAHLVDTLLVHGIDIKTIFAPEHGFRGEASAGAHVKDGIDAKSGLPITSLYGSNKKPTAAQLEGIDILIFDIQDVGARFYTYISTMHYCMEAAAENNVKMIVLDRPNPNGFYVDGPVLQLEFKSFVGMHPIPVVHGLTVGELAQMINGEGWLEGKTKCRLTVVPCKGYSHLDLYTLPIAPSPNLPNMTSIYLYPSLCFFEGTQISVGRGTDLPFQVIGHPDYNLGSYAFTPRSIPGVSDNPKHKDKECNGHSVEQFGSFYFTTVGKLHLDWLEGMYKDYPDKDKFFTGKNFIDKLAGTDELRQQLVSGESLQIVRAKWQLEIEAYKNQRKRYLLYPDFE